MRVWFFHCETVTLRLPPLSNCNLAWVKNWWNLKVITYAPLAFYSRLFFLGSCCSGFWFLLWFGFIFIYLSALLLKASYEVNSSAGVTSKPYLEFLFSVLFSCWLYLLPLQHLCSLAATQKIHAFSKNGLVCIAGNVWPLAWIDNWTRL